MTNDVRHAPDHFLRKLWRLGFQAGVDEVVTCGAAVQFLLAERADGGAAFVIGSQALVDHVADAGLRVVNNTPFATRADVVVVGGHEEFDYPRAAHRHPGRAARCGAARRPRATGRSPCPTARGPARGRCWRRSRRRPAGAPTAPSASRSPRCTRRRATGSATDGTWPSATGWTPTPPAPGAPGMDAAVVLTGVTGRAEAAAADPAPTHVADSLAALVLR